MKLTLCVFLILLSFTVNAQGYCKWSDENFALYSERIAEMERIKRILDNWPISNKDLVLYDDIDYMYGNCKELVMLYNISSYLIFGKTNRFCGLPASLPPLSCEKNYVKYDT